jgi:hypothetical protein
MAPTGLVLERAAKPGLRARLRYDEGEVSETA